MRYPVLITALLAVAGAASAQPAAQPGSAGPLQFMLQIPGPALLENRGEAILSCGLGADRRLIDCTIKANTPGGFGIEALAFIREAPPLPPLNPDGQPIKAPVLIGIIGSGGPTGGPPTQQRAAPARPAP